MHSPYNYNNTHINIENPNICPHCHVVNNPIRTWFYFSYDTDGEEVFLSSWLCANSKCNKIFVTLYKRDYSEFIFNRFLNGYPVGPKWPKPIADLQSGNSIEPKTTKFIATYLQSLTAENDGLDELAGMGYRKAIEYLVKDWAIQNNPDDRDKIESLWLGQVIAAYYDGD